MQRPGESYTRAQLDEDIAANGDYDIIVIGSGIGGLATAALLTRHAGKRVLVLERHYVAGGFTHSFARPGYDWDVGLHYIGDVMKQDHPTRRLFDEITGGAVEWASMGEVYDRIVIGEEVYDYRAGLREWRAQMGEYFPDQQAALDGYIDAVKEASASARGFFLDKALPARASSVVGKRLRADFVAHAQHTTLDVLRGLTDDQRLIAVLTGQWGDYGLPPARSSFAMHSIVTNHYFRGGAYPAGGASVIPAAAEAVINSGGGRVLVGAEVKRIIVRGRRAIGVEMDDGRVLTASAVVSNAGVHTTYGRLLDGDVAADIGAPRKLTGLDRSASHLTLYLGLDADTDELGLRKPNLWLYPGDDHDAQVAAFEADPTEPFPLVYLSFPSAKDPDFARRHPGKATIDVITLAKMEWFSEWDGTRWHRRGDDYERVKAELTERLLAITTEHVPSIRGHIDVAELSTPLTTRHFTNYAGGELYGLDHTAERFATDWLRARTPIKDLYLTGQDIMTAGVGSALFAGAVTAAAMEGPRLLRKAIRTKIPGL